MTVGLRGEPKGRRGGPKGAESCGYMIFFRVIAQLLIAASIVLLGADALDSLESGEIRMRTISEFSQLLTIGDLSEMLKQSYSMSEGPKELLLTLVGVPAWAALGLIGMIMAWIFADRG